MPLLIALLAPLLWGSTYAVVSLYLTDYSPYWVAVWRALPAGILLLLLHPRRPPLTWSRQFLMAFCNINKGRRAGPATWRACATPKRSCARTPRSAASNNCVRACWPSRRVRKRWWRARCNATPCACAPSPARWKPSALSLPSRADMRW